MSHYRLLNRHGCYVTLKGNLGDHPHAEDNLVNPLTSTNPHDVHRVRLTMFRNFPSGRFIAVHDAGETYGDDWVAIARHHMGTYTPNPIWYDESGGRAARTYRVIVAEDPFDPSNIGTYVVTHDPRSPAIAGSDAWETTSYDKAHDAKLAFESFFTDPCRYEVVTRYGTTWDEIAANVRTDWEESHAPTCNAFTCAAPVIGNHCVDGHRQRAVCVAHNCGDTAPFPPYCDRHVAPFRRTRLRDVCEDCETRRVHHDDLSETFVCDCVARELLDAGKPVATKGELAPA